MIRPTQSEGHRHEVWAVATWQNLKHFETSGAQIQQALKQTCVFLTCVFGCFFCLPLHCQRGTMGNPICREKTHHLTSVIQIEPHAEKIVMYRGWI